jgi:catechol 2,3-dioxygenase-like lactoylglutathione lyase family enzyme
MTVTVPGAHLVELLQLDPLPQTTAAADANVIGAWVRVTVEDLERTLHLYQDAFGLPFTEMTVTNASFGNLIGENSAVKVRMAAATMPGTRMRLEFLEVSGIGRHRLAARIQDPGRGAAAAHGPQHRRSDDRVAQRGSVNGCLERHHHAAAIPSRGGV